jgi:hypothetical protein
MSYMTSLFSKKLALLDRSDDARVRAPALIIFPLLIVAHSVWQGIYNLDPHHWGLMLSNAKDLAEGKAPYRDIFIQYGLLTTMIHGAAYALLGENLRALICITASFYSAGLVGVYFLSLQVTADKKLSLFSFVSACLLHPVTIYPWSNYIAFPFLVYGTCLLLASRGRSLSAFFAGVLLALAVLSREGLFPAVLAFSLVASVVNLMTLRGEGRPWAMSTISFWGGLFLPLVLFFVYLEQERLLEYWYKMAVLLPRMYMTVLMPYGLAGAAFKVVKYFVIGIFGLNIRVIFFASILLSSAYVAKAYLRPGGLLRPTASQFLLAILSLLLLSAALHGIEIFRLASGVTAGVVIVYWLARRYGYENLLFLASSLVLIVSLGREGDGNYFIPTRSQISQAVEIDAPTVFRGQRWPIEARDFYQSFARDMRELVALDCGVRYYQNTSHDAFLSVLSPFVQYQLAPFRNDMGWERLRPELDVQRKIARDKDIVLFSKIPLASIESYRPPIGYLVARRYVMPKVVFFEQADFLLIVVPARCSKFLSV